MPAGEERRAPSRGGGILGSCLLLGLSAHLLCCTSVNSDIFSSKRVFSRKRESIIEEASLFALPDRGSSALAFPLSSRDSGGPPQDASVPDPSTPTLSLAEWRPNIPAHVERAQQVRRAERSARYQQAIELNKQGKPLEEIASILGVTRRTIQCWFTKGTFPDAKRRRKRPDSFKNYAPLALRKTKTL